MFSEHEFHTLAQRLFPLCRSITGNGVRNTLKILREYIPIEIQEIPTGTPVFDWIVPREWNARAAWIETPDGMRICDFAQHNLHLLNYSVPMEGTFPRHELDAHLHSLPELPDAIPYVTSYYEERWGFCLQQRLRESLPEGDYRVFIDTTLQPGSLTLGDLVIPGRSKQEIFVSTYTCHPSMANNEVSGMTVATFLARAILERGTPRFTYRFVFAPETIGPLCYLAAPGRKEHLRRQVLAAFNVTCVGDERGFSLLPSKWGDTLTDRVARHVMHHLCPNYREYTFALDRGSDECQYSSPGVDLPMVSVMRSKYGTFPEYHTSLDDLSLVTGAGLKGSFDVILRCFDALEDGISPLYTTLQAGEPWFSKYGLRSTLGAFKLDMRTILGLGNVMSYADGRHSLLDVAEKMQVPVWELFQYRQALQRVGLLRASELPIEQ